LEGESRKKLAVSVWFLHGGDHVKIGHDAHHERQP
jgi:hypothetical protein